jgi:hypothetical protein
VQNYAIFGIQTNIYAFILSKLYVFYANADAVAYTYTEEQGKKSDKQNSFSPVPLCFILLLVTLSAGFANSGAFC